MAILTDRKLFAKVFLLDVILWLSLPIGNYPQKISHPAWHYGYPYRQETVRKRFPIRHDTMAILTDRKLFAKGFPSGLAPWLSLPTGNYSQKVSHPAWHHGCPYRQETIRKKFPIRHDPIAIHPNRKLFLFLTHHKSRGLLVGHDDDVADLHPFGLVYSKGDDIGNVFSLQGIHPFIHLGSRLPRCMKGWMPCRLKTLPISSPLL